MLLQKALYCCKKRLAPFHFQLFYIARGHSGPTADASANMATEYLVKEKNAPVLTQVHLIA